MFIPRLLFLATLIAGSVVSGKAQSSQVQARDSAQPQLDSAIVSPEFHLQIADRSQYAPDGIRINQSPLQFYLDRQSQSLASPEPQHGDTSCLFMRTYRVKRDEPRSDSTRFAGYSECQPAHRYQSRDAAIFLEITPR